MAHKALDTFILVLTLAALAVCVVTPILVFTGTIAFNTYLIVFNLASLGYFLTAPFSLSK